MTLLTRLNSALAGLAALPRFCEIISDTISAEDAYTERDGWRSDYCRIQDAFERLSDRFSSALRNLGVTDEAAITRFLAGTETTEDHCTARELEAAGIVGELSGEQFGLHEHIRALTNERDDLRRQLEAEREAHAKTSRRLRESESIVEASRVAYNELDSAYARGVNKENVLKQQLSAAQSDLDALTKRDVYCGCGAKMFLEYDCHDCGYTTSTVELEAAKNRDKQKGSGDAG